MLSCKPLSGVLNVDLMGQYRPSKEVLAYIASENRILVQTEEKRILIFDRDGYICHDDVPHFFTQSHSELVKLSTQTVDYGRFLVFRSVMQTQEQ